MEEYERLASAFPKVPPFLEVQAALRSGFHVFHIVVGFRIQIGSETEFALILIAAPLLNWDFFPHFKKEEY